MPRMTASFVGRFWCLLREGNAAITVEAGVEVKSIKVPRPESLGTFW